jgi:hypothetical protein
MNLARPRWLKGKTVDRIERDGHAVKICFADGTALSVSGDRPQFGRLMVYYWDSKPLPEHKS